MTRRGSRQLKTGLALLLLLSLAGSLVAPAGAWECDTGQRCRAVVTNGCCCPEESAPAASEVSCCESGEGTASPACAMPPGSALNARAVRSAAEPLLVAAPHCRCRYALADRSENAVAPVEVRALSAPVHLSVPESLLTPPSPPSIVVSPRSNAAPERPPHASPPGARAPPARSLSC